MSQTDRLVTTVVGFSPFDERDLVVAALRRRRRGDRESWETAAAFVPLVLAGCVIAVAGTNANRVVLAIAVPVLVVLVIGWLRQGATAGRLLRDVAVGDADALDRAARFLDRPEELSARAGALRLAAAHSADPFISACYDLEAADSAVRLPTPALPSRGRMVMVAAYAAAATVTLCAAWAIEIARHTSS